MAGLITAQCCNNCKFVFREGQRLECRRNPPQATILVAPGPRAGTTAQVVLSAFPPVTPDQHCGEYKPRLAIMANANEQPQQVTLAA